MVDYDLLAERLAGFEGGARYKRLGAGLMLLGLVALVCMLALPIYQGDDASLTYFDMGSDPDGTPFAVENEAVLAQANLAIVGTALTVLMGVVLLLEGMRIFNLRRYLSWHAEARATALYSLSAVMALFGLAGCLSVLGFAISMPTASAPGVSLVLEASSPAGLASSVLMALATLGMMAMAYYSAVLSVHRGGGKPTNRRMARFTMMVAAIAVLAIAFLRLGIVVTSTLEIGILDGSGDTFELVQYFTHGRIDYLGSEGDVDGMRNLDVALGATELLLALVAMAGLGGLVGISAFSLGGASRRVRLAVSLPTVASLLGVAAILAGITSMGTMEGAVEDLMGTGMDVSAGASVPFALLVSVLSVLLALAYARTAGTDFTKESLLMGLRREREAPVMLPDEARPPSEEAPAVATAAAPGEPAPPAVEVVEEPALGPPRRFRIPRTTVILVAMVAAILVLAGVLYALFPPDGGDGNGDGDGVPHVNVAELPTFEFHHTLDERMGEGTLLRILPLDLVIPHEMGDALNDSVLFVNRVTVEVTWQDEPDSGFRWTNQPDTFSVDISDDSGLDSDEDSGENTQGGVGDLLVEWAPQDTWLVYGMVSLVDISGQPVDLETSVSAEVEMVQAGDQTTRLGMTRSDSGNDVRIEIVVSGTMYAPPGDGQ